MAATGTAPPIVLIAAARAYALASGLAAALERDRYAVILVHTGSLAIEWARDVHPDLIVLQPDLPDMPGVEACRLLQADLRVGHNVPILMLAAEKPTPDQRVAALRAGAWDFVSHQGSPEEISLKLQTYVQAKRNLDVAFGGGLVDAASGLYSRPGLARRARELGALMARMHGALACVVFAVEADPKDSRAASVLARSARVSDVAGALSPTEFALLAPATDHAAAVKLAQRIGGALHEAFGAGVPPADTALVRAGYDAVASFTYSPIDPVELLPRAAAAVRDGIPEPDHPWVRRFDVKSVTPANGRAGP